MSQLTENLFTNDIQGIEILNFPIKNNNINKISFDDNFDDFKKKSNIIYFFLNIIKLSS